VLGRVGQVDEVAAAVGYLSGPEAAWVTGTLRTIDGGHTLRRGLDVSDVVRQLYGTEWVSD
jgi:NAD(P)-dependent dehydrogenase (short-subunit alcohol dehydrogenase family)